MNRRKRSNTAGARFTSQVNKNRKYTKDTKKAGRLIKKQRQEQENEQAKAQFNEGALKGAKSLAGEDFPDLKEVWNRQTNLKELNRLIANTRKNRAAKKNHEQKVEREVAANRAQSDANRQERGALSNRSNRPTGNGSKKKKRELSKADKAFLENMNSRNFSEDYDLKLKL